MNVRPTPIRKPVLLALVALAAVPLWGCHKKAKHAFADNDVLYERAQGMIEKRKFQEAINTLGDVGLSAPVSDKLDPEVKLALADAYYYQAGSVKAIEAQSRYEQFLSFYPLHPKARYARYMVGVCLMEQTEDPENDQEYAQKALRHFEAMVNDVPAGDPWNLAARAMLLKAQDRLAEHEWTIANFYYKRQHWPGAAGRLRTVVDQYPGSRRRPQAMYDLAVSLRNIGNNAEARLTLDRLMAEFPGTPLAQQALELKGKIPEGDGGVAKAPPSEKTETKR